MSSILSHNATVPLWGFIVIIAVGSILIIATIFLAIRYYLRYRGGSDADSLRNDPEAIRRMTVRRGRLVPQSHYMSLTGSRFGVGAFGQDDSRSGARSKSPFEWWNNSHSRSISSMSQMTKGQARHTTQTPESLLVSDTPRKQPASPLRIAASSESMSEKTPAFTYPSRPAASRRTSQTTNFSRPALRTRPSVLSPSINSSLPQIMEVSPHQSTISSRQSKHSVISEKATSSTHVSELGAPLSPISLTGFDSRTNSHAEISSTFSSEPPFDTHPAGGRQRSKTRTPRPSHAHDPARARCLPRSPRPADHGFEKDVLPTSRGSSAVQEAPALPYSPRRSTSTLNSKQSSNYRGPGDADHTDGQLSNASLHALPQPIPAAEQGQGAYWESRQDLQPVRRKSQKGNVLRKKSLKRAEMASLVT